MSAHKKFPALGRGLDALISTQDEVHTGGSSSINEVPLFKIMANPNQPRREFDADALQELAESIRQIGIIQPITLRLMDDGKYQIIAGERRWRASQMAGLFSIPAYVRTADDENMMQMALVENIQARRPQCHRNCTGLSAPHRTVRADAGQTVGKSREKPRNYCQLPTLAQTPCTSANGLAKQRSGPRAPAPRAASDSTNPRCS